MDFSQYPQIEFRRKFWKFLGVQIKMTNPADESVIGHIKMKALRWKDDVRLFADESETEELMSIKARQAFTLGATFDVTDSTTGQPIVVLQRKGLRSAFVRDYWNILDTDDNRTGFIQETSSSLALARRYLEIIPFFIGDILGLIFAFLPQTYRIMYGAEGQEHLVGEITHRKNPYVVKMLLDFTSGETALDKRVGIAATTMLAIIDAAKNN